MSPESYVLLLISCWLLLAAALLWGMLRIARRHYATNGIANCEDETASQCNTTSNLADDYVTFASRSAPRISPGQFASMLCTPGKTRC